MSVPSLLFSSDIEALFYDTIEFTDARENVLAPHSMLVTRWFDLRTKLGTSIGRNRLGMAFGSHIGKETLKGTRVSCFDGRM